MNVEMAQSPFTSYLANLQQFNLTATKQKFAFVFTMNADSDTNGRIGFNVGNNIDTVYLDNITLAFLNRLVSREHCFRQRNLKK